MHVYMRQTQEMIIDETSAIGNICRLIKDKKDREDSIKKGSVRKLDAKDLQERREDITKKQIADNVFEEEEERRMKKICGTKAAFNSWKIKRDEVISRNAEIKRMLKEREAEMNREATKVHTYVHK
jgi:hypothetical protein